MKKQLLSISLMSMIAAIGLMQSAIAKQATSRDLFELVESGDTKAVKNLLQSGTNINELNNEGKTALDIAVEHRKSKTARILVKYGAKLTTEENLYTLKNMLKNRAIAFFITGLIFTPFLWIGGALALSTASNVMILTK